MQDDRIAKPVSTVQIKVAAPLYVYAILDPASSPHIYYIGYLGQMAQASFYRADKPLKNSVPNSREHQSFPATPVRRA
jgi:hypothetical protein